MTTAVALTPARLAHHIGSTGRLRTVERRGQTIGWRYVMATSPLAEIGRWAYPSAPHSFPAVLHSPL